MTTEYDEDMQFKWGMFPDGRGRPRRTKNQERLAPATNHQRIDAYPGVKVTYHMPSDPPLTIILLPTLWQRLRRWVKNRRLA